MKLNYSKVSAESDDVVRVLAVANIESDEDIGSAFFVLKYSIAAGRWSSFRLPWEACSITTMKLPHPEVLVLSPEGFVGRGYGGFSVDDVPGLTGGLEGPFREIRVIGQSLYCVGMGRCVYIDFGDGGVYRKWGRSHARVAGDDNMFNVCGFNSVHGVSQDRVWAVGFLGEIWSGTRHTWSRCESPTNLTMHKVQVLQSGWAVAVGQCGLIIGHGGNGWEELLVLEDEEDIWDICEFMNKVFVSTSNAVYELCDGMRIAKKIIINDASSFGYLDSSDNVIWSVGSNDVCYSCDLKNWVHVAP